MGEDARQDLELGREAVGFFDVNERLLSKRECIHRLRNIFNSNYLKVFVNGKLGGPIAGKWVDAND
jgi:hypothetical protein